MYTVELNKEEVMVYVRSFDIAIRAIAGSIAQSNNAAISLRDNLSAFQDIHTQLQKLNSIIDTQDAKKPVSLAPTEVKDKPNV